jgi:hypothetical protein
VLEVVDASPGGSRAELDRWLRDEHLPARLRGSNAAMTLIFEPIPLPADRMSYVDDVPGLERRLTLLTLTDAPAADGWPQTFAPTGAAVAAAGVGRVELAAPFLATIPGTDAYVDQLR